MIGLMMLAATAGYQTGNDLYADCQSYQLACSGYVGGVADGIAMMSVGRAPAFCIPAGVIRAQLKDVALNYLRDHPESRQRAAAIIVKEALGATFPCTK